MEGFKTDVRKIDAHSEEMKDYGKQLKRTQERISSIRGNLRYKLSGIEDIGKTLGKIEENMETETSIMLELGSVLGTIASNYRNTERRIVDFGTDSISESQLSGLQREALEYENTVGNSVMIEPLLASGGFRGPGPENTSFISDMIREGGDDDTADIIDDVMKNMENGAKPGETFWLGLKEWVKNVIDDGISNIIDGLMPKRLKDTKDIFPNSVFDLNK